VFENVSVKTGTAGEIKNAKGWRAVNSEFVYEDNKAPTMINCVDMDRFFTGK
jgi:hypothetical protein